MSSSPALCVAGRVRILGMGVTLALAQAGGIWTDRLREGSDGIAAELKCPGRLCTGVRSSGFADPSKDCGCCCTFAASRAPLVSSAGR